MKKILMLLLAAAGLVGGVACEKEPSGPGNATGSDITVTAAYTMGFYFPRDFTTDSGVFLDAYTILFSPTEPKQPYYNPSPTGAGSNLLLTFYNKANEGKLLAGTYKVVDNSSNEKAIKAKTIAGALSSVVDSDASGKLLAGGQNFISGQAVVTIAGEDDYEIVFTAVTPTGDKVNMTYKGKMAAQKMFPQSTLKADKEKVALEGLPGAVNFYGDFLKNNTDIWVFNIYNGEKGTEGMQLWIQLPKSATPLATGIPAGTYPIGIPETGKSICILGERNGNTGELSGSWYVGFKDAANSVSEGAPATTGEIKIERDGGKYTLTFEFKDDYMDNDRHTIKGNWTGTPSIKDMQS